MNRINILWGLGGAVIGAISTYFVMEYIYEKEMAELFVDMNSLEDAVIELEEPVIEASKRKVVDIADAEMYTPRSGIDGSAAPEFHHVVSHEENMESDEAMVMEAIWDHENGGDSLPNDGSEDDPEEEGETEVPVDVYNGIYLIEVAEVNPGRRIVARFNHDDCSLDISSVMSVKTDILDDRVEEGELEGLLGLEAHNILMNAEPSRQERMIGVRNNLINLDFAISY